MHELSIPADLVDRVTTRTGRAHPFDVIEPAKTALLVIDMQNYFVKEGHQGEVPLAREIVPAINRMATELRRRGGHVVWVKQRHRRYARELVELPRMAADPRPHAAP